VRLDLDLLARRDLVRHALREFGREGPTGSLNRVGVRVEREHVCGVLGDAECEAAVAAAELENGPGLELRESTQRRDVGAFRIE
jgi:hypothetical protein